VATTSSLSAAWAASRTKNTYLATQYKRMIVRKDKKRTLVAVAHSMFVMAYSLQKPQCTYQNWEPTTSIAWTRAHSPTTC
jgi:hypothetical protein